MRRWLVVAALVAAAFGTTSADAADEAVPTVLTAHDVVMRFDGFNGAWYFGDLKTILVDGRSGDPIVGRTVDFFQGDQTICSAVTNADGVAVCADLAAEISAITNRGYVARFAGDDTYGPSEDDAVLATILGTRI